MEMDICIMFENGGLSKLKCVLRKLSLKYEPDYSQTASHYTFLLHDQQSIFNHASQ